MLQPRSFERHVAQHDAWSAKGWDQVAIHLDQDATRVAHRQP
jgi:hypothetical protein